MNVLFLVRMRSWIDWWLQLTVIAGSRRQAHDQMLPTIVVIPSKEHAYDPNKDPEMIRAKLMFSGDA